MRVALEETADRTYIALVEHMDRCLVCTTSCGNPASMCEPGFLIFHRWDVAEYRAAQARSRELEVLP